MRAPGASSAISSIMWSQLVTEACTSTLLSIFQEPGLRFISNYLAVQGLRFDDVSAHPEQLEAALRNMLGDSGARFIQLEILKQIYRIGGVGFVPPTEMDLTKELEKARELFPALADHRCMLP